MFALGVLCICPHLHVNLRGTVVALGHDCEVTVIHRDHCLGGMLLTRLISPLLIRQAHILRSLSSSIMSRMTEVGLQSEEGVP